MHGLWLENQKPVYRQDLPAPEPAAGEALVEVRLAGICGTDLQLLNGYYPFTGIPGHEFVGRVVRAQGFPQWEGRRVVGEINIGCGECSECRANGSAHCLERQVLGIKGRHGAFAEQLVLPVRNLHAVPDSVPDESAVFTEPVAAAVRILQQIHIRPSDHVVVVGAGRLGQLIAQVLYTTACHLTVVARHTAQREQLSARGIRTVEEDSLPHGTADVVVEATGAPGGLAAARRLVRPRGTVVLKSTYAGSVTLELSGLVVNEIRVIGSRCGPFGPALRLLEQAKVDPRGLIDKVFPLEETPAALHAAAARGAMKILVRPQPRSR